MAKKQEIKCPWCSETIPITGIKVNTIENEHGTIQERRCPRCHRVLASYLEEEGEFMPRMRTF